MIILEIVAALVALVVLTAVYGGVARRLLRLPAIVAYPLGGIVAWFMVWTFSTDDRRWWHVAEMVVAALLWASVSALWDRRAKQRAMDRHHFTIVWRPGMTQREWHDAVVEAVAAHPYLTWEQKVDIVQRLHRAGTQR